ncbi:hypothetical protein INR49_022095 [Caranx melampygus]|nr:hypothetical protein INR49_022095 [Caranx melampygus]
MCVSMCPVQPLRAYTPQGYKTPTAEKARPVRAATATPTSAHLGSIPLSSSAPKALYGKSRQQAWQVEDNSSSPSNTTITSSSDNNNHKKHVDTNSKNVFGQPRLRASLRDLRSPRRTYKSTIEDDLKKLIIMDNPGEMPQRDPSPRRTLQRTFSDESLCSGRRDASFANSENQTAPTDVLFTCTLPTRRHAVSSNHMQSKKGQRQSSPLRRLDPGLMPLPDTACGLEWSSLVNAAKAYEGEERGTSGLGLYNQDSFGANFTSTHCQTGFMGQFNAERILIVKKGNRFVVGGRELDCLDVGFNWFHHVSAGCCHMTLLRKKQGLCAFIHTSHPITCSASQPLFLFCGSLCCHKVYHSADKHTSI